VQYSEPDVSAPPVWIPEQNGGRERERGGLKKARKKKAKSHSL